MCSSYHHGSDHNFDITHVSRVAYLQEASRIPSYILSDGPALSRTFATASVRRPIAHFGAHAHGRTSAARKNQTSRLFRHIPAHGYSARGSKISRISTNSPGGRVRPLLLTRPPAIGFRHQNRDSYSDVLTCLSRQPPGTLRVIPARRTHSTSKRATSAVHTALGLSPIPCFSYTAAASIPGMTRCANHAAADCILLRGHSFLHGLLLAPHTTPTLGNAHD